MDLEKGQVLNFIKSIYKSIYPYTILVICAPFFIGVPKSMASSSQMPKSKIYTEIMQIDKEKNLQKIPFWETSGPFSDDSKSSDYGSESISTIENFILESAEENEKIVVNLPVIAPLYQECHILSRREKNAIRQRNKRQQNAAKKVEAALDGLLLRTEIPKKGTRTTWWNVNEGAVSLPVIKPINIIVTINPLDYNSEAQETWNPCENEPVSNFSPKKKPPSQKEEEIMRKEEQETSKRSQESQSETSNIP
jgi:hypothetical protein